MLLGMGRSALGWVAVVGWVGLYACGSTEQGESAVAGTMALSASGTGAGVGAQAGVEPLAGTAAVAGTTPAGGSEAGAMAGQGAGMQAPSAGSAAGSAAGSMAGMQAQAGMDVQAGQGAAGDGAAGAGAAGEAGGGAAGMGVVAGPIDYGAPGPHEVLIEKNVGEAFRNTNVADDTRRCERFLGAVGGGDSEVADDLTSYPEDMDRQLYTLFRPATLEQGKAYPVITWGNGTCSHPLLFTELLEHLASHGFLVIATNTRWTGGGVEMLRAVDFVLSENDNPSSALFGRVDTEMVGACGHSQGSGATVTAGADPRIVATVPIQGASRQGVAALNGPTFLIAGELDTLVTPSSVESAFGGATVPAVYGLSLGQDHLMPGLDPSPIQDAVTGWFKIHLSNEEQARELFYGDDCTLCSDPRWEISRRNL